MEEPDPARCGGRGGVCVEVVEEGTEERGVLTLALAHHQVSPDHDHLLHAVHVRLIDDGGKSENLAALELVVRVDRQQGAPLVGRRGDDATLHAMGGVAVAGGQVVPGVPVGDERTEDGGDVFGVSSRFHVGKVLGCEDAVFR